MCCIKATSNTCLSTKAKWSGTLTTVSHMLKNLREGHSKEVLLNGSQKRNTQIHKTCLFRATGSMNPTCLIMPKMGARHCWHFGILQTLLPCALPYSARFQLCHVDTPSRLFWLILYTSVS